MTKLAVLVVYAYTSFTSQFGMGPKIAEKFELTCRCKVILVNSGDAAETLQKLKLEGKKTGADVVIGVDGSQFEKYKKDLNWNTQFVKFDKSPLAFIYNKEIVQNPPESLEDLLLPQWENQIIIQDPRLSTTGLNFLFWLISLKGEEGAFSYLEKLKKNIKMVSPSWDMAYGLFKKNQAKLVLSYWTSPAFHIQEEDTKSFKAAEFKQGHYEQVEYVVINPNTKNKTLSKLFIQELVSEYGKKLIMEKNFMFPIDNKFKPADAFKEIGYPQKIVKPINEEKINEKLDLWLKKWRRLFS